MEKKSFILGFILAIVAFGLIALASAEDWNLGNPVTVQNQNVTGQQNLTFLPENAIVIIGAGGNVTSDVANLAYYPANQTLVVKFDATKAVNVLPNASAPASTGNISTANTWTGQQTYNAGTILNKVVSVGGFESSGSFNYFGSLSAKTQVLSGGTMNCEVVYGYSGSVDKAQGYVCWFANQDITGNSQSSWGITKADGTKIFIANVSSGNVGIGTATGPSGGGTPVLVLAQAGSAPTGMGSNTAGIYVLDVSGTAELFTIDEGGTSTQQTSHPSDFLNTLPNDENHTFPWVYTASNPYLGKKVTVDEEAAFKALEVLTGKQFVWIENISKTSWADTENHRETEENNKNRNTAVEAWLRNASNIQVDKTDAFETITETITETTKNITGFDTEHSYDSDGNIEENIVPIYEIKTKTKSKKAKKENVFFDKKNGTFYRKPTRAEAEAAVGGNYSHYVRQDLPKWMKDRGAQ